MVKLLLRMKADLENVEAVEFPPEYIWNIDGENSDSFEYLRTVVNR